MKKALALGLLLLSSTTLFSQNKVCTLTKLDGSLQNGYVKDHQSFFGNRFKLYDAAGNFVKIKAKNYQSLKVDNAQFIVLKSKEGTMRFMEEIITEGKAKLYRHSYQVMVQMSMHTVQDYYLMKNDVVFYLSSSKLKDFPERYFGGVPALLEDIRKTKKRDQDSKIVEWVKTYNQAFAETN